jgi:hypothetical protein
MLVLECVFVITGSSSVISIENFRLPAVDALSADKLLSGALSSEILGRLAL